MSSTKESLVIFCGVAAAALYAESLLIAQLYVPHQMAIGIGLHLFIAGILTVRLLYLRHRGIDARFTMLLLPMVLIAGPIGAGICLLAAGTYIGTARSALPPSEWIQNFFSHDEEEASDRLNERIAFGLDDLSPVSGVEPFQDILNGGTVLQKQMAIAKITRYFQPRFAPLLLQAVQDRKAAVRVQAATALAKIERDFMARSMSLEDSLREVPPDSPSRLDLARLYDDYAYAGLVDENSQQSLRTKAIRIYEDYLAKQHDSNAVFCLARLYMRQDEPEKSGQLLAKEVMTGSVTPNIILWYMESLLNMKKLPQVRELARNYAPALRKLEESEFSEKVKNLIGMWSENADSIAESDVLLEDWSEISESPFELEQTHVA